MRKLSLILCLLFCLAAISACDTPAESMLEEQEYQGVLAFADLQGIAGVYGPVLADSSSPSSSQSPVTESSVPSAPQDMQKSSEESSDAVSEPDETPQSEPSEYSAPASDPETGSDVSSETSSQTSLVAKELPDFIDESWQYIPLKTGRFMATPDAGRHLYCEGFYETYNYPETEYKGMKTSGVCWWYFPEYDLLVPDWCYDTNLGLRYCPAFDLHFQCCTNYVGKSPGRHQWYDAKLDKWSNAMSYD